MNIPTLTLENLIQKGYFPKELVPAFQTEQFAKITNLAIECVTANGNPKSSKCLYHSFPKDKLTRRSLAIPNPRHQLTISDEICQNWHDIYIKCQASELSASRLTVNHPSYNRAVSPNYNFNSPHEKITRSAGLRYGLYTDISRYYSTIYTHSIPWAIHTKQEAKEKRNDNTLYGNKLDKYLRNTQDEQTLGIPIGTDTSFIIAELICSVIDIELIKDLGKKPQGYRFMDDYYLYFENREAAESALRKLHKIMKNYELEPNGEKTDIIALPEFIENIEITNLRNFNFSHYHTNQFEQQEEIVTFFNQVFYSFKKYPNENIVKYALSKIKRVKVNPENWEIFESILLHCLIADSRVINIISEILINYYNLSEKYEEYEINLDKIGETVSRFIADQAELYHSYEVAWGLWLCKSMGIKTKDSVIQKVINIRDSIVAVIAFDLYEDGLIQDKNILEGWYSLMTRKELYSENWLLAYEGNIRDWLPSDSEDYVNSDEFFSLLKQKDISFYDKNKQVPTYINEDEMTDQGDILFWY